MAGPPTVTTPPSLPGEASELRQLQANSLDAWTRHDWRYGLQLEQASGLDAFVVRTANSTYEITVLSPLTGEVLVRGGAFFPVVTRARLAGASLGGSFLKRHGIYIGFRLEFVSNQKAIVTTPVRTITSGPDPRGSSH